MSVSPKHMHRGPKKELVIALEGTDALIRGRSHFLSYGREAWANIEIAGISWAIHVRRQGPRNVLSG